jgi:hypothetical protein
MSTFAVSEQRKVDGTPYARVARYREPSRRELSSPAEFISDVVSQIAPGHGGSAEVSGIERSCGARDVLGRAQVFISNGAEWPHSFMNVCRSLWLTPEEVRHEVFADARFGWGGYSGHVAFATVTQLVGSFSRLFLSRRSGALALPQL